MILASASQILQHAVLREDHALYKTTPEMTPAILPCHYLFVDGIGAGGPLILLRKYMSNPILHLFH